MGRGGREGKGKGWEYEGEEREGRDGRKREGMDGKENGRMGRGRIIRGGKLRVAKGERGLDFNICPGTPELYIQIYITLKIVRTNLSS